MLCHIACPVVWQHDALQPALQIVVSWFFVYCTCGAVPAVSAHNCARHYASLCIGAAHEQAFLPSFIMVVCVVMVQGVRPCCGSACRLRPASAALLAQCAGSQARAHVQCQVMFVRAHLFIPWDINCVCTHTPCIAADAVMRGTRGAASAGLACAG